MLVPPHGERVVDVDQLLGEFVQLEPAIGIAINLEPGGGEIPLRPVPEVEAGAGERVRRRFMEARLVERTLEPRPGRGGFVVMLEERRVLETEAIFELAELRGLEARARAE